MPTEQLLAGWGRTAPSRALVHEPDHPAAVVERIDAPARRGIIARGLGRSYGDAAQNAGGDVLATAGLDRIEVTDPGAGVVRVGAGVSIDSLLRALLPLGWFPMVVPGTSLVSIGGAIASDNPGTFRHGCFTDAVDRIDLVAPATGPIECGPDDEAFRATAGGMGLTGVITGATLRCQPVETTYMVSDSERVPDVDECMRRMLEHDSQSLLGFPMEGWTLALDVPAAGEDRARLLDGLDELVVGAGGRVYLTKDARLRPELLAAMYPRLAEWRAIRDALDPGGIMCSDLDRRLDLTGRRSG
ncbi:MAG: FAD-binding protein [Actinomycetota bacterium]